MYLNRKAQEKNKTVESQEERCRQERTEKKEFLYGNIVLKQEHDVGMECKGRTCTNTSTWKNIYQFSVSSLTFEFKNQAPIKFPY